MNRFQQYLSDFITLLYPRLCEVCGQALVQGERCICSNCLYNLPLDEEKHEDLLLQFREVFPVEAVYSLLYYHRFGPYRQLIHALKYRSRKQVGILLGESLGRRIPPDAGIDLLLPLPLHPKRERERGYNHAAIIALGITNVLPLPVEQDVVIRVINNPSQTGLTRMERNQNVQHIFQLKEAHRLAGHHVLIIDDVITTGSTLSSLLAELRNVPDLRISIACLARAKRA